MYYHLFFYLIWKLVKKHKTFFWESGVWYNLSGSVIKSNNNPTMIELVHLQVYVKRNLSMKVFVKTSLLLKNKFASSIDESIC